MRLVRLPRSKVQLGSPLPWNVRDESACLLLSKGHVVDSEHMLSQLLERGAFVDFEEIQAAPREAVADPDEKALIRPLSLFGAWEKMTNELKILLDSCHLEADFSSRLDGFTGMLVKLIDANVDVALFQCIRQDHSQFFYYGYNHSIHTAVLSILMARHLGWSPQRELMLANAALTMNMSILALQGQMAAQDTPPTERQRAAIHAHPTESTNLLRNAGVTNEGWIESIVQHHEHADGGGYPLGLTAVVESAVALRVADVFMAKISPRLVRPSLSPQDAVRQLFKEDNGGPISTAVIKQIGIFPPGDFVKLASGELAIVVQHTSNARAPIVAAITDKAGHPVSTTLRRDSREAAYAIVGVASDPTLLKRLPPERLFGYCPAPVMEIASQPVCK